MADNLFDMEIISVSGNVQRVRLTPYVEPVPVEPPPLPEGLKSIWSDDGTTMAYMIDTAGEYTITRDIHCAETAIFVTAVGETTIIIPKGVTVYFGGSSRDGCSGINPTTALSGHGLHGSNDLRFSQSLRWGKGMKRLTVKGGGRIVHEGNHDTLRACAIGGDYTFPVTVEGVKTFVRGIDPASVECNEAVLRKNFMEVDMAGSVNRKAIPANVRVKNCCIAEHNILFGGNSEFFVGPGSRIKRNIGRHAGPVTNGYFVSLYKAQGVTVSENLSIPTNGRGVIVGGYPDDGTEPVIIANNILLSVERPNVEYGNGLEPNGIRSRYNVRNLTVMGNHCLAIGGRTATESYTSALGMYLTHTPGHESNLIERNTFDAVLLGEMDLTTNKFAASVGFIGEGKSVTNNRGPESFCPDVIINNRLRSNCVLMCLSHTDGGCNVAARHESMEIVSKNLMIAGFRLRVMEFVESFETQWTEELEAIRVGIHEQLSSYVDAPDPTTPPAVFLVGRFLGSKLNLTTKDGPPNGVEPFKIWNSSYDVDVVVDNKRYTKLPRSNNIESSDVP